MCVELLLSKLRAAKWIIYMGKKKNCTWNVGMKSAILTWAKALNVEEGSRTGFDLGSSVDRCQTALSKNKKSFKSNALVQGQNRIPPLLPRSPRQTCELAAPVHQPPDSFTTRECNGTIEHRTHAHMHTEPGDDLQCCLPFIIFILFRQLIRIIRPRVLFYLYVRETSQSSDK